MIYIHKLSITQENSKKILVKNMNKWDENKLEQMNKQQNEFTKTRINYKTLSEKYFEIMEITHSNGDVMPLTFKDVELCYKGKIDEDISLPEIDDETQSSIDQKEQERHVMHIKHFSRSISHQDWFDFLDEEIEEFIKKYPQYSDIIL